MSSTNFNGVLNIYKPKGITSHGVVSRVRRIAGMKKVGHTGTLDPNAEGVLPICLGKATRLCDTLMAHNKKYRAVLMLGLTTDTQDIWGNVLKESPVELSRHEIQDAIYSFKGTISQIPPMYSAIKKDGRKLYELARQGVEIEREARRIEIFDIQIIDIVDNRATFDVECSKGTYIRTLCHDIGEKLKCGGCMADLIRLKTGDFDAEDSVTLEELEEFGVEKFLIPADKFFQEYTPIHLNELQEQRVRNGVSVETDVIQGNYRVYSKNGEFLAIAENINGKLKLTKTFYS